MNIHPRFIDCLSTKLYYKIIAKYANNSETDGIAFENHHIVPKCMGGSNDTSNIARIPSRVHFICHYLLTRMCEEEQDKIKMKAAVGAFTMRSTGRNLNSREYAVARKGVSEYMKNRVVSQETRQKMSKYAIQRKLNPFKGKHHTERTKNILSESKKGKNHPFYGKKRPEHSRRMKITMKGRKFSNEHKKNISKSWHSSRKLVKCSNCGLETTKSMNTRWHESNCKKSNHHRI